MSGNEALAVNTTTQRTSKPLKAQLFLSLFLILFGGMSWFLPYGHSTEIAGMSWTAFAVLAGAVWYVITKLFAWWHHE